MPRLPTRRHALIAGLVMSQPKLLLAASQPPEGTAETKTRLAAIEAKIGGRLGLAALDTGSGKRIEHRATERFAMCSTFKMLASAAILKHVDDGKDRLDRRVPYEAGDIPDYAPVTKEHLKEGAMSLDALCEAAIELSDNTAGNLLLSAIGGPSGLTAHLRSLGDQATRLDRTEPDLNTAIPGDERDTTTPSAMVATWRELLLGEALSQPSRERLQAWLVANKTGGALIRAGVGPGWAIGAPRSSSPSTAPSKPPRRRRMRPLSPRRR